MLAEFIVMFRESLEIALVLGIILAYLHATKNERRERDVYLGASAGLVASVFAGYALQSVLGGLGEFEELFEGAFMITAALLISWLLLWMFGQAAVVAGIRRDVRARLEEGGRFGLFALAFTLVFREGVEIVLLTYGIFASAGGISLLGSLLGIAGAVLIGFLVFYCSMKFNFRLFFKATMIVLVLLAAGLFSGGVHELQEAKVLPTYIEHVYDINPPQNADGSYPLLHEKGAAGGMLKALAGYDGNPSDLQVAAYLLYLLFIAFLYSKIARWTIPSDNK